MISIGVRTLSFLFVFFFIFSSEHEATAGKLTCPQLIPGPDTHFVLLEGAGDVVRRFYGPAFQKVRTALEGEQDFRLIASDNSKFWGDDPARIASMREGWALLNSFGLPVLDQNDPAQLEQYENLKAEEVFVANIASAHVDTAIKALNRRHPPKRVFIEKPLDSDADKAVDLLGVLKPYDERVWAYDHYRARVTLSPTQLRHIHAFLGKHIVHSNFYFLEDRSSADPTLPAGLDKSADGAIEIEKRQAVLGPGVTLDLMSHYFPLLRDQGSLESISPLEIRAARYTGAYGDPDRPTDVEGETYASFKFVWNDNWGHLATGAAYVGKGVRGVKALGPEFEHNAKLLEYIGANGNVVRFDLRSRGNGASTIYAQAKGGRNEFMMAINADPYAVALDRVARRTGNEEQFAIHVEQGRTTLNILDMIRRQIRRHSDRVILIPGGMAPTAKLPSGRPSLWVEEIEQRIPAVMGGTSR